MKSILRAPCLNWIGASAVIFSSWNVGVAEAQPSAGAVQESWPLPAEIPNFLPDLESVALPDEQSALESLLSEMASKAFADPPAMLAPLDQALSKVSAPTKLRGTIQYWRAGALSLSSRNAEAIDAIEESIRLLPNYSGPLIAAAGIYAYNNQPDIGADYLIRASRIDPASVRGVDDYDIGNITRRLSAMHDERRVNALSDSLIEINWVGRHVGSQSALAAAAIKSRMREGNLARARALVPKLLNPAHSRTLLVNRAYSELWPDLETWSGPLSERLWRAYLLEARERWTASQDVEILRDYVGALAAAGHDKTIITEVLPVFSRALDPRQDHDLLFVVTSVAGALAREGRWSEVDALFERVLKVWPLGSHANALNAGANRARYLLFADRPKEALGQIDAAIADARKRGPEVNMDAIAAMHHARACILHELGRGSEAAGSIAQAVSLQRPSETASLHLCMGNIAAARDALIEALKFEPMRDEVIGFLQPHSTRPFPSKYGRRTFQAYETLLQDSKLRSKVEVYGRILDYPLNAGAPAETR